MQDIYETFEFNKIKEHLLEYAKTELGKFYISELKMFDKQESVENALLDLSEMSSIIIRFGPLPINNSANALTLIVFIPGSRRLCPDSAHTGRRERRGRRARRATGIARSDSSASPW